MTPTLDSLLDALLDYDDEVERLADRRPDLNDPRLTPEERTRLLAWIRDAEKDVRDAEARFVGILTSIPGIDVRFILRYIPPRFRARVRGVVNVTVAPEGPVQ